MSMSRAHEAPNLSMTSISPESTEQIASNTSTVTSPFESLPCELRNAIYDELWQNTPVLNIMSRGIRVQFRFRNTQIDAWSINESWKYWCMPEWLFACKLIFHEALEELLRQLKHTIGPYLELMPVFGWNCEWFRTARGSLTDLMAVDDTSLWLSPSRSSVNGSSYSVRDEDQRYIGQLEGRIDLSRRVRELRIRAQAGCCCGLTPVRSSAYRPCGLDFKTLEPSSFRLDTCEFHAMWHKINKGHLTQQNTSRCIESFGEEVERAERLWLARDGVLSVHILEDADRQIKSVLFAFQKPGRAQ